MAIPKRVQQTLQAQSKLAPQAATPFFDPWAAVTAPVEPAAAPRRILPNIMTPPEPAPVEADAAAEMPDEAPTPRVRRVKPRAPRVSAQVAPAVAEPAPMPESSAPAPAPAPAPVAPRRETALAFAPRPLARTDRSDRSALPAGQRWKARLPRACW